MLVEIIGNYVDRATSKVYQVEKRTESVTHALLAGASTGRKGPIDFITSCGISLSPKSDDDSVFEMIEIDGTIYRQ